MANGPSYRETLGMLILIGIFVGGGWYFAQAESTAMFSPIAYAVALVIAVIWVIRHFIQGMTEGMTGQSR